MDEQIKALLNQVRILEEEANKHSGAERAELFKAAGRIKNQVATLLNQHGKGQQQQGGKVPDPDSYFGDYLTQQQRDWFNNLTPEMESYFSVPKIQNFDNAPSAPKQEPAKTEDDSEDELRRRILNALGIPC